LSSQGQITRDGATPTFAAYCTSYCIIDLSSSPPITRANYPQELQNCALRSSGISGPQDIRIPPWQRKLVWDEDNFDELIHTQSSMYGTVILSRGFNQSEPWILIDGLQRFATGVALLNSLYEKVLSPSPTMQTEAEYFATISNQIGKLSPVFKWNHEMLLKHGRSGIKTSYERLFNEMEKYVTKHLNEEPEQFGKDISSALLVKQIAVDPYSGFLTKGELIKTFIEINRTGEQLTPIDLLRAELIDQMDKMNFSDGIIDEIENSFTEIFQPTKTSAYYSTVGTQVYNIMFGGLDDTAQLGTSQAGTTIGGSDPAFVFPNWNNLEKQNIDDFFEYIQNVWVLTKEKIPSDRTKWKWPYLSEIAPFKLPFCMVIWFYYSNHYLKFLKTKHGYEQQKTYEIQSGSMKITLEDLKKRIDAGEEIDFDASENQAKTEIKQVIENHPKIKEMQIELEDAKAAKDSDRIDELEVELRSLIPLEQEYPDLFLDLPDFLDGDLDTRDDIRKFYRAMVRKILDGNIGKTENILHQIMRSTLKTMDEVSAALSPDASGALHDPPNENWLKGKLLTSDKSSGKPKLVFNACLLPLRGQSTESQDPFTPLIFRTGTGFFNVDHLIPDSKSDKTLRGHIELQNLVNLAPLEWEKNNLALATWCSLKLSSSQIYDTIKGIHPYCKWLVDDHYINHQNDNKVFPISGTIETDNNEPDNAKVHIFDSQVNLLEGHQNSITDERITKLLEILSPRL